MGYERYPRNTGAEGYDRNRDDYSRDYGSQRDSYGYGRDDQNRGGYGRNRDDYGQRDFGAGSSDYGSYSQTSYGQSSYGQRGPSSPAYDSGRYGTDRDDDQRYRQRDRDDRFGGDRSYSQNYGQSYGNYGGGQNQWRDQDRNRDRSRGDYGRQPQGYDYQDRGFFNRAGDEVRSWFGDEDAERRRQADQRNDERYRSDDDYQSWRNGQIQSLDRDYDEYRRENQQTFSNEFGKWRTEREGQRSSLSRVNEHMDVVGSDGEHIGTVDKVRGDRILLTKNDADAGGRHHSIPSRWIQTVDDKVTVRKTAAEAKAHWRDEERNSAFFGDDQSNGQSGGNASSQSGSSDADGKLLNRSFSGTY